MANEAKSNGKFVYLSLNKHFVKKIEGKEVAAITLPKGTRMQVEQDGSTKDIDLSYASFLLKDTLIRQSKFNDNDYVLAFPTQNKEGFPWEITLQNPEFKDFDVAKEHGYPYSELIVSPEEIKSMVAQQRKEWIEQHKAKITFPKNWAKTNLTNKKGNQFAELTVPYNTHLNGQDISCAHLYVAPFDIRETDSSVVVLLDKGETVTLVCEQTIKDEQGNYKVIPTENENKARLEVSAEELQGAIDKSREAYKQSQATKTQELPSHSKAQAPKQNIKVKNDDLVR